LDVFSLFAEPLAQFYFDLFSDVDFKAEMVAKSKVLKKKPAGKSRLGAVMKAAIQAAMKIAKNANLAPMKTIQPVVKVMKVVQPPMKIAKTSKLGPMKATQPVLNVMKVGRPPNVTVSFHEGVAEAFGVHFKKPQ
jgi:hypothetical protein